MNRFQLTCLAAALSAGLAVPGHAQDTMQPSPPSAPDQQSMQPGTGQLPTQAPASGTQQASDLTGQTIYSATGHKIGTVQAMTVDAQGKADAVVSVERYLGMGGKNVVFPVSSLQSRDGGGYKTSLSATEIKHLPEASSATPNGQ